ncbi:RNA polymerase sigma factor [Sphingobium yanoikuyae]|uniref:RNA polymerase sigma factor n=1 Tax=Sphingobium yanoikuyae TaxID=13690 RepID=UPI0035AEF8FF
MSALSKTAVQTDRPANGQEQSNVEEIYRDEAHRLARYLRWRLRSADDANDLVQEAFERLARSFVRGRVLDPRAYLRRIVRNLLIDRSRRPASQPHLPIEVAESLSVAPEQSYAIEAADMIMLFRQAVASLPPRTREVFTLHRLEEISYRDIAQQLGISIRTVEWHIAAALEHIDKAIHPDD